MGEKTISTQVKIDGDIVPDFSQDWEVAFQGEKYIMPLRQPQGAKENTSLNSTIDLTFQHWAIYQLKRWMFFTVQPVETGTAVADKYIADVILNLGDFCNLFGQVLRHYYGDTITIDLNPDWDYKQEASPIAISHSYIWDVLIKLYELFAVRWSIEPNGDSSHYVIKVGYPAEELDHIFEYGFEGGLLKVERQVQSEDIRNMLLGRGGEKNIPKYYFKKSPDEKKWRSDPDWIEELANIYFTNLMPATFRSYVQGWKAAHISKYPGYAAVGESNAYAPWAYRKGYTDSKFDPMEYVKDDESIAKYGPLLGGLDNNEEIYPSIQGSGMDIAVDVEQIEDEPDKSDKYGATLSNIPGVVYTLTDLAPHERRTLYLRGHDFTIPEEKNGVLDISVDVLFGNINAKVENYIVLVYNYAGGESVSPSGIEPGNYYYEIRLVVYNLTPDTIAVTVGAESPKLTIGSIDGGWKNTFDIWVKNIWDSTKLSTETDEEYAERVWKPILGDREQNTAKVIFTTGALAISEDYEFTIVDFPQLDTSKSFGGESSHWRIKLAKSDADLESTGLYVPSTQRQGKAGDKFVFIGTEMTHHYVVWAETALDDWKKDQLRGKKDIKPTWVVTTDRVRLNNEGKANALIQKLRIGNSLRLADKRFIQPIEDRAYETLYLQSITYTYREPSSDDAALNPDVAIVLSNEYATTANPVASMQGEISALQRQIGSISNIEQIVRAVGDRLYLRKSGISDRSLSPTQFFSLLTSGDFRAGIVGGAGWGFFKGENGNWVLEADRVNVRQEMQVNTLVINQAEGRGGMEIDTAAFMEVTRVVETSDGYVCYFDQKNGSVANLFHIDDVAYSQRWTPENNNLKFYKRRVVGVDVDNITLTKGFAEVDRPEDWPDSGVNGSGIPAEKDNVIHFGNYTDKTRQYVKVRDVVGGGYERYIEELNSVNATGVEYYFVGKQAGQSRWFVGNKDLTPYSGKGDGSYIEYINRRFNLNNVTLSVNTTIGDKSIEEYIREVAPPVAMEDIEDFVNAIVNPKLDGIQDQIDGVIENWFANGAPALTNYPASDWATVADKEKHLGDLYFDNQTGLAYRFSKDPAGAYYWNDKVDSATAAALAAAARAQDTADGKRRVFTALPYPPYDEGDLWVNATYPAGITAADRDPANDRYHDDILRCDSGRDSGVFDIGDWELSSGYTDDSLAQEAWEAADQAQKAADQAKWDADAARKRLDDWADDGVISPTEKQGIKDEIARIDADKAHIAAEYSRYGLGTPAAYNRAHSAYRALLDALSAASPENIAIPADFARRQADYYTERTAALSAIAEAAKKHAEEVAKNEADKAVAGFQYLKEAMANGATQFMGGLMLSSLVRLGEWDKSNPGNPVMSKVWAGMNGLPLDSRSIASWWGGDMADLFDRNDNPASPVPANPAAALVRMDGSAYFAKGNIGFRMDGSGWLGNKENGIKFSPDGRMTFGSGVVFDVSNVGGLQDTLRSIGNAVVALDTLFVPCDAAGKPLKWEEALQTDNAGGYRAKSLKAAVGVWSDQYVSGKGLGAAPGGSGGGGAAYDRLDAWGDYSTAKAGWVLSAALGHDLHTRLQNVYGKPTIDSMLAGFVTLATRQEISGEKIFTNSVYVTNGRISGEISSAYTNHGMRLGISGRDYCDFLEYGAVWNFYKSRSGTETLVAKISEAGMSAKAFIKDGGTASQVLMADGSVVSKVTMTAVSHLGWTSNAAAALLIPTMSALALWDGRYNAAGSNLQYCDRGRFGDIVTHGHGEYVTALGISGNNITWTRNGATNSIAVPFATNACNIFLSGGVLKDLNAISLNRNGIYSWSSAPNAPGTYGALFQWSNVNNPVNGTSQHWITQLASVTSGGGLYVRTRTNTDDWRGWEKILTNANFRAQLDPHYLTVGTAQEVAGAKTFLANVTARHPATTGGSARGFVVSNHAGTEKVAFGSFCSAGVQEYAYVGWGDNGWQQGNNLAVCSSFLRYKGHDILHAANYASMLDGRYVNAAGDKMDGDLAVRKMHLQGGNEFNCDDKLWIAYRSTPQGVNVCHADQPFTYGSAGHEVLHRGNYSNLVNALNQPLTIRCGTDAKLIFDNTDGERYTRLSFREAGAEYANITAHSEAFVFAGKPVSAPYFKADRATLCPNLNADLLDGLHLSRTPAANAVPAYDAETMLPVSAGLKMQNDKMAELTAPGWYRVFSSHSSDAARASLLLFLGRNYNYTSNENYIFSISLGCGVGSAGYRPTVTQLSGRAITQLIPKIRVLQKWNSAYHVDIYYSGTVPNGVYSFGIGPGRFAAPVAAAIPDGYTSYEFDTVPNGFRCDGIAETLDLRLSRYLFFKHSGANNGIYLSPNPDGSLSISAHSGYSYAKSLGTIGYDGCFRITGRTAIGPSGFGVGLQLRVDNSTAVEVCGGNTTMGMGCHRDGRWYWWRGTTNPDASSDKAYVMNFDGGTWDFKGRLHATGAVYSDTAIGGKGLPSTSDKRLKTIVADVVLPLDAVAGAPLKSFFWNDGQDKAARCGTVAQYWEGLLPEVVYKQPDGYLAVDYGALAHAEAVTVARELVRLRQRVEALEHENRKLKRITGNA